MPLLQDLAGYDAFIHTAIEIYDVPHLCLPFKEVSGEKTEDSIIRGINNSNLVVVRGETGTGKTCSVNCALTELSASSFPIVLSPVLEDVTRILASKEEFTKYVLSQTQRTVQKYSNAR